ncbi:MAG TPA: DUF2971 domain-containing protein [Flavobacteriales bacterium]|nr:DUF2971 domain-containing protein [Flavobacteriales bacterium]
MLEISSRYVPQSIDGLLYKFRSQGKWLEHTLRSKTLYFATVSEWNDPWDVQTTIDTSCTFDELLAYHQRILPKEHVHAAHEYTQKYIDDPVNLHYDINELWSKIASQAGLCAFAGGWKHVLLWSYYAEGHTGVALGFAPLNDIELFNCIYPMRYEKHPPNKYFEHPEQTFVDLMLVKSEVWKHEDERRAWHDPPGVHPFKKEALVEITFGASCQDLYVKHIIDICVDSGFNHLQFYKAHKVPGKYELNRHTI